MEVEKEEFLTEIIGLTNKSENLVSKIIEETKEAIRIRAMGGHTDYRIHYGSWIYIDPHGTEYRRIVYPNKNLISSAVSFFKDQGFDIADDEYGYDIKWKID